MSATTSSSESVSNKPITSSGHQTQRLILKGLSVLSLLACLWLIFENITVPVSFNLLNTLYNMPLGALLAISGALMGLSVGLFCYSFMIVSVKQTQVSQRKVERLEVSAESSMERVKVLEHKIETLETALKRALVDKRK